MKYWSSKIAFCLIIACGFLSAAPAKLFSESTATFKAALESIGLDYNGNKKFILKKSYQVGNWDECSTCYWKVMASGAWRGPSIIITAHKEMGKGEAKKFMEEEYARLAVAFDGSLAYPGMISNQLAVPAELKPVVIQNGPEDSRIYVLHATKELTYGVGSREQATHRSVLTFRYCEKIKTLVKIEIFVRNSAYKQKAALKESDNFTCKLGEKITCLPD